MSEDKINARDLYAINEKDLDKLAEIENKAGVYATIFALVLFGCIPVVKDCEWYVGLSMIVEGFCTIPVLASLAIFAIYKDKFYAFLYDYTLAKIDLYSKLAIIGASINFIVCETTTFLVKFNLTSLIIGALSLLIILFAILSKSYVKAIPFRIRRLRAKDTVKEKK